MDIVQVRLIAYGMAIVAFIVTMLVFPKVLAFAKAHNIVDNPNARKLQRVPVPMMGGAAIMIGILVPSLAAFAFLLQIKQLYVLGLLFIMYLLGLWDDIKDVSPTIRFVIESVVVWLMMYLLKFEINDFHGFMGIYEIPDMVSVPLSVVAGVGLINAVNLIDGVDGYCSTYGMMACTAFAILFLQCGDVPMYTLALTAIGALLPFFFHNVFGVRSKMFLGDGGSLMLGTLLTLFVFNTLTSGSMACQHFYGTNFSLVAFCLAVLAVPVFDTLKVMIYRMIRKQSPFHPDKTHLHHLFIDMEYSHLATSGLIICSNVFIILMMLLSWLVGASINSQVYMVILMAIAFPVVFYFYMVHQKEMNDGEGSIVFKNACNRGRKTHVTNTKAWKAIRRAVDSPFLSGIKPQKESEHVKKRPDPRIRLF